MAWWKCFGEKRTETSLFPCNLCTLFITKLLITVRALFCLFYTTILLSTVVDPEGVHSNPPLRQYLIFIDKLQKNDKQLTEYPL